MHKGHDTLMEQSLLQSIRSLYIYSNRRVTEQTAQLQLCHLIRDSASVKQISLSLPCKNS